MKVLVTCPPMLGMIQAFEPIFKNAKIEVTAPKVVQTLSVEELIKIVPEHDGWIIGDDPATKAVFEAGKKGKLKAAVKWGIGVDNVDFEACKKLHIPICNTPNMFGNEVADIALGYIIALARETFPIHIGVTTGKWPKFQGISLSQKNVALVGLGDIGSQIARRLKVLGMNITAYDPYATTPDDLKKCLIRNNWPENIEQADFIVLSCSLNSSNKYMLNEKIFNKLKTGVRIVNVGRGPLINQYDLENALKQDIVHSVALDVFEVEPLPKDSYLRLHPKCIFGSHNASNTKDAVIKTSELAIKKIQGYLYE